MDEIVRLFNVGLSTDGELLTDARRRISENFAKLHIFPRRKGALTCK